MSLLEHVLARSTASRNCALLAGFQHIRDNLVSVAYWCVSAWLQYGCGTYVGLHTSRDAGCGRGLLRSWQRRGGRVEPAHALGNCGHHPGGDPLTLLQGRPADADVAVFLVG